MPNPELPPLRGQPITVVFDLARLRQLDHLVASQPIDANRSSVIRMCVQREYERVQEEAKDD